MNLRANERCLGIAGACLLKVATWAAVAPAPATTAITTIAPVLAGAEARASLVRYAELYRQARAEDEYFTRVVRSQRPVREASVTDDLRVPQLTDIQDPDLRAEWQLRFPDKFVPVELVHLQAVRQARLLDLGLWQILLRHYGLVFSDPGRFTEIRQELREFIRARPTLMAPNLRHAVWWKVIADGRQPRVDMPKDLEASGLNLLIAMEAFEDGVSNPGPLRVRFWLEARLQLYSLDSGSRYLEDYDRRTLGELRAGYQSPSTLVRDIEASIGVRLSDVGVLTYVEQKTVWLAALQSQWKAQNLYGAAATAGASRIQLIRSSNKELRASEVLECAQLWYLAKNYDRALETFALAQSLARGPWERGLALKGSGQASLAKSRTLAEGRLPYQEWAVEYLRRALIDLTATAERDELLNSYADALSELGYADAVADVYESIFRGGSNEESQISGLIRLLDSLDRTVASEALPPRRVAAAQRYASLLAAFARAQPNRPQLMGLFGRSLRHRKDLGLESNAAYLATLFEVENVLTQRRSATRPVRAGKEKPKGKSPRIPPKDQS